MKKNIPLLLLIAAIAASCSKHNENPTPAPTLSYTSTAVVTTYAGTGAAGSLNGPAATATFYEPTGVAVSPSGNVYVADFGNSDFREISSAGVVTTVPYGNGYCVATDAAGNVYVNAGGEIDKITPSGNADTIPGSAKLSSVLRTLTGIAVDATGNVYISDEKNSEILKITTAGVLSTLAGNGTAGFVNGTSTQAEFNTPAGLAVDAAGNVFVADQTNSLIRKITPAGVVSTYAGSSAGYANGNASEAAFYAPGGVAIDSSGDLFVADFGNDLIREISSLGVVTTVAGNGYSGLTNGTGDKASFYGPVAITIDNAGNLYVADEGNSVIRKISPGVN
jgi:serine/threonine-protein kinase